MRRRRPPRATHEPNAAPRRLRTNRAPASPPNPFCDECGATHARHSYLTRKYVNPLDGEMFYSVLMPSPRGNIMHVQGASFPKAHESSVSDWDDSDECPRAQYLPYTKDELDTLWSSVAKKSQMIPVAFNVAVNDAPQAAMWLDAYLTQDNAIKYSTGDENTCQWATVNFAVQATLEEERDLNVIVNFVHNQNAKTLDYSVSDFEDYVAAVHSQYLGPNSGWDSYMDKHFGVDSYNCSFETDLPANLDDYVSYLKYKGASYHGHGRTGESRAGTDRDHLYIPGPSSLAIELRGDFDDDSGECFEKFDWCTWDTEPEEGCTCGAKSTCVTNCRDLGHSWVDCMTSDDDDDAADDDSDDIDESDEGESDESDDGGGSDDNDSNGADGGQGWNGEFASDDDVDDRASNDHGGRGAHGDDDAGDDAHSGASNDDAQGSRSSSESSSSDPAYRRGGGSGSGSEPTGVR